MFAEVAAGGAAAGVSGDARGKVVLGRGCDPVMAERAQSFLPPMIGGATVVGTTDDESFFREMRERKGAITVVHIAPGACRWDAARRPIPGGNAETKGWGLQEYRVKIRELLGEDMKIVETTEESEIVGLLRAALGLPVAARR